MTLRQFAKTIGFSPSTVSKAFSNAKDVSEKTRKQILKAATELGVFESFYKTPKATKNVAVIVSEFNSGLYAKMINLLSDLLQEQGAVAQFSDSGFSVQKADNLIRYYSSEQKTDGIIVLCGSSPAKKYSAVPIVYFGKIGDPFADSVEADVFSGICEVIMNFKLFNHKKIGFIGEKHTRSSESSFRKAMALYGFDVDADCVFVSDARHEQAGYEGMAKLLDLTEPPTAVLAAYDDIAIGAMTCAKERGLFAPKDFSIAGIDNSQLAANPNIMLSSVDYNDEEICNALVSRLMHKIDNPHYCVKQRTVINCPLVVRNTVGAAPRRP